MNKEQRKFIDVAEKFAIDVMKKPITFMTPIYHIPFI